MTVRRLSSLPRWWAVAGAALLLAACSSASPRLYVLNSPLSQSLPRGNGASFQAMSAGNAANMRGTLVGVAPVTIPDYLDRPEMVERTSANEVKAVETDRWAERLSLNTTRVLTENLGTLLGADRVVPLPARTMTRYEVSLDLSRFDVDTDRTVLMVGRWSVVDTDKRAEVASGALRQREPVAGKGFEDVAAAMSRSLASASAEIAAKIAELSQPGRSGKQRGRREAAAHAPVR